MKVEKDEKNTTYLLQDILGLYKLLTDLALWPFDLFVQFFLKDWITDMCLELASFP